MKERVNFLEKGAFVLTYKKMMLIVGAWIVFCLVIFAIQSIYGLWVSEKLKNSKNILVQLNAKKEQTMALIEATKSPQIAPDAKELSEIYLGFPVWSEVVAAVSRHMPPEAWLSSISSAYFSERSMNRKIEINGTAKNTASIARFTEELNKDPMFLNIILNKSDRVQDADKKQGSSQGYSFVITGEVKFGEKKWD